MGVQPRVDAAYMEQVHARRQLPHHLPFLHQTEAHRALRPPAATAAAFATTVRVVVAADGHASVVQEGRQRGHGRGAQPTVAAATHQERPGAHEDDPAAASAARAAAQAIEQRDYEDADGGDAEADDEEGERVVGAVAATVR